MESGIKENLAGIGVDGESVSPPPPISRVLIVAVIVMGVMLVAGVVALVWVVAGRVMHRANVVSSGTSSVAMALQPSAGQNAFSRLGVPMQAGEAVESVTARPDGSLAVLVSGPHGARLLLWQPESARLIAEFVLTAPTADAPTADASTGN